MKEYKLMEDLPDDADNTRARLSSIALSIEHANQGSVRIPAFWTKVIGGVLIAAFAFMASRFLDSTTQQQRQDDAIQQLQKDVAMMRAEQITNTEWRIHSIDSGEQLAKQLEQMQRSLDANHAVLVQHERESQHGQRKSPNLP
jgi:hypothetical protein